MTRTYWFGRNRQASNFLPIAQLALDTTRSAESPYSLAASPNQTTLETTLSEQAKPSVERYDQLMHWRCRQLGGEVTFRYCRKVNNGLPCARLITCWHTVFDVATFLAQHYDPQEIAAAWNQPAPEKMNHLLALVAEAQRRKTPAS